MRKLICVLALIAVSCTVKENRFFCPAWCIVYSDGYIAQGCGGPLTCNIAIEENSNYQFGRKEFTDFTTKGDLVLEVPRNEEIYVDVFCGQDGMELIESVLKIPMGCCCDSIYAGHGQVFISGEEGETGLPLNKDFASIIVEVKGVVESENPFRLRIRGNVDGYELPGGKPHKGEFDYMPESENGTVFCARVPRQLDDSLMMDIIHKDDGSLVTSQELGKIIKRMGYDWSSRDLRDISIGVEVSKAVFSIEIEAWDESETITLII